MKLTELKDLRVIKKSLEPEPEPKPQQNQPRKRSVELTSKEEEHARNEGLTMGQKVRMMDTNDTATIIGFGKGYYELELGDLTVDLHIERIPGSEGIPEWAALEYQLNYFRQVLRKNLKHRGRCPPQRTRRSFCPLLHLHLQHPRHHQRNNQINQDYRSVFPSFPARYSFGVTPVSRWKKREKNVAL